MPNTKISALTSATTPLAGTEVLPIVQSSTTKQVSIANVTAGRLVDLKSFNLTDTSNPYGQWIWTSGTARSYYIEGSGNLARLYSGNLSAVVQQWDVTTGATRINYPLTVADNVVIATSGKGVTTSGAFSLGFGTNGSTSLMTLTASGSFGALGLGCTPGPIGGDLDIIANQNGVGIGYSTSVYRRIITQSTNVLSFASASNTATLSAAGAWTNASDVRLKKNITDIKYGLDTVMATQPRSYNRKDVDGDFIGFVAQELKTLVPEVVFGSEDEQYTVDYGSLVAIAFKAIQELKAEIETLKGGK